MQGNKKIYAKEGEADFPSSYGRFKHEIQGNDNFMGSAKLSFDITGGTCIVRTLI